MKTVAGEKNNRIDAIESLVRGKRKVLIMIHDNPDPDALASASGFQYLLQSRWKIAGVICYGGIVGRAENRAMIKALDIEIVPFSKIHLRDFGLVALIDTQPGSGNNSLPETHIPAIVIDHHVPLYENSKKAAFTDIRADYGSTSTIITEYLIEAGIAEKNRKVATALLYGIKSDTRDLGRETGPRDMAAYLRLFPHVLLKVLSRIEHPRLSRNHFRTVTRAINQAQIYRDVIIADLGRVESADNLAEMADFLIRVDDVKWVLCLGGFNQGLYFSIRSTHRKAHAGNIARKMAKGSGAGGGHCMVAGGRVDLKDNYPEMSGLIVARFLKEIRRKDFKGEPLAGQDTVSAICAETAY